MKVFTRSLAALSLSLATATVLASDCAGFTTDSPAASASSASDTADESSTSSSIAADADDKASPGSTSMFVDDGTDSDSTSMSAEDVATSLAVVEPVIDCSDLLSLNLTSIAGEGTNITSAEETTSDDITYCVVQGYLPPDAEWQIQLPVSTWTQRYMQIGCGGLCGSISTDVGAASGAEAVENGNFALGSTDMDGGSDGEFGLDDGKRADFAYAAQHWTSEVAKELISNYYGQEVVYSIFNGCSDGGREAVMEALRYPEDFNGIIAGAPAMLFSFQNSFHHAWLSVSNTDENGDNILLTDRLDILHDAVVSACDALDGIEDGLLSDPRICDFDVYDIECASDASDNSTCLTTAEVETVAKFYAGPIDAASNDHLTVAESQFGSELGWDGVFVADSADSTLMSTTVALAAMKYLIFTDYPGDNYTLSDFDFANSSISLLRDRHPLLDSVSADLSDFVAAGGKLILWHGFADPQIPPGTTIAYHEALQANMGADVVESFERLYLLPGVHHCGEGEGPSYLDLVTPMMEWIEEGVAPHEVMTSSEDDSTTASSGFGQWTRMLASGSESTSSSSSVVTRPVYPYPSVAKYIGSGSVDDAANFEEGDALYTNLTRYWLGEDFFNPYTPTMD